MADSSVANKELRNSSQHSDHSRSRAFKEQSSEELVSNYENGNEEEEEEDEEEDDNEEDDEYHLLIRDSEHQELQQSIIVEANRRLHQSSETNHHHHSAQNMKTFHNKNKQATSESAPSRSGSLLGIFARWTVAWGDKSPQVNNVSSSDEFIFRSSDWGRFRTSSGGIHTNSSFADRSSSLYGPRSKQQRNRLGDDDNQQGSPYKQTNKTRTSQTLFILILFFLLVTSVLFLVKLLSLIQQEQRRQISIGNDLWNEMDLAHIDEAHRREYEAQQSARWLVASPKCHIPTMKPWDQSIGEYTHSSARMDCKSVIRNSLRMKPPGEDMLWTETLTEVNYNRLYVLEEAERFKGLLKHGLCCYRNITRSPESDDDLEYSEKCTPLKSGASGGGIEIDSPLIEVHCPELNYTNVHTFVVHDQEEEEALRRVRASKLNESSYYNILMVGVDTISRLNGVRQLNRTLGLLKEKYKSLDFYGYNKVGENTFPNLIPLLTGLKPNQLQATQCWLASAYTDESERGDDYLDNCKYLWNFYQQAGYMTYFSEDWPVASTFNYLKPGFKHEPTAYYGRPFTLARQQLLFPRFGKSVGCADCQLDRPIVEVDLKNLEAFIRGHEDTPYFAFHWINCPQHDDLNGASRVDYIIEDFFGRMREITADNRTFVFFFSDHGYRWNPFLSTRIGHYESSLPLLTIAAPKLFIEQHPDLYEQLKSHQTALLTPFDMFHSLLHLRNLGLKKESRGPTSGGVVTMGRPPAMNLSRTTMTPGAVEPPTTAYPTASTTIKQLTIQDGSNFQQDFKTISIFDKHSPAQLDRSCIEAGIPDNYCVCHQFKNVLTTRDDVLGAAYYLVYVHLESRLSKHLNLCHQLELEKLHKAELFTLSSFNSSSPEPKTSGKTRTRRRRRSREGDFEITSTTTTSTETSITTTPSPTAGSTASSDEATDDKEHLLPKREYNIFFSTKPGSALFQEVVRYYGDDFHSCISEIRRAKKIVTDVWAEFDEKRDTVLRMNKICRFSVHSESISRLNLYRDQSKCVKSNIELKKICYCKALDASSS